LGAPRKVSGLYTLLPLSYRRFRAMAEERKPRMSIAEIEAVLVEMPDEQFDELIDRVVAQKRRVEDEIDPAILERARRTMDDIRAGRENTVPAEEVLDMLDRMAS
jgi:hypothetical protein